MIALYVAGALVSLLGVLAAPYARAWSELREWHRWLAAEARWAAAEAEYAAELERQRQLEAAR